MKWPFKFYNDEGYILALIENKSIYLHENHQKSRISQSEPYLYLK